MPDTGNGATIILSSTGAVGNIRNIGELAQELGKLETSHLGTTGRKTYMPDDLSEPGEIELEVEFDTSKELPALGAIETMTVTYPLRSGEAYPANHAGSGFVSRVATPQLANSTIQVAKIRFTFDGITGPTFSKSSSTSTTTTSGN